MDKSARLLSIDVLRGMTICLMILVNTPGSWSYVYPPLSHAAWHGCTPTDLVFPFFLFIVGMSIFFSFKKYNSQLSRASVFKILKRTGIIFGIGLLLNLYPYFNFETVRIMGVLQRIALAYGVGALLCLSFKDHRLIVILALILLGYWSLLYWGGGKDPYSLQDNLVRKIDIIVFGESHIYKGFGIPFDPEGLLSFLPAVGTIIIGFLMARLMDTENNVVAKIKKLVSWGIILIVFGGIWSIIFPINKPLWTSSYVLYTSGWATITLCFLTYIIDNKKLKSWAAPFVHFGSNPLFIFVFSGLYAKTIIYLIKVPLASSQQSLSLYNYLFLKVFSPVFGNMNGSLFFAIAHIILFWCICYILYKKRVFIKI